MNEWPAGWATSTLGEVTSDCAQRVPSGNKVFTYVDIGSVDRETKRVISPKDLMGSEAPSRARKVINEGDVLVAMTRPNLNAVAIVPRELDGQIASTGFDVLRPRAVETRWIFYAVRTRAFIDAMSELVQGALYPAVRSKDIRGYVVPIAPLTEQKRIADKLDGLLARLDACRERLGRIPDLLKRFRQSVLTAGTNGKLTRVWREGREASIDPQFWSSEALEDLCVPSRALTYGVIKLGDETPDGVPCLRTSNVRWLKIDTLGMKRIAPLLSAEYGRTVLQGGEVLVNVRGTLGGVAVADETMRGWNVSREVAVVPADVGRIDSHFLAFWIGADESQRRLQKFEKGVAYTGINLEDLRTLPVVVPPLDEQSEIVKRVQRLLDLADHLEFRHNAAVRIVESMASSLLTRAFRGELVPQDPNDEPASELLAKIEIDRISKAVEHPRRRKATKRKQTDMSNTGKDAIKAAILSMHAKVFSFEELRIQVSEDYESMKATVFQLLEEPKPIIRQVFNKKAEAIQFERVTP